MLEDRVGHGRLGAFVQRVDAAHGTLQLRELADHAGGEVRLAQLGRLRELAGIAAARRSVQPEGKLAQALDPLELGAQPLEKGAPAQLLQPRAERDLAVLVEEELAVGKARAQDALVASAAYRGVAHLGVRDRHECREELALLVLHREILLVAAHFGDEHFRRQLEEFLLEISCDAERLLDQPGHGLQELG